MIYFLRVKKNKNQQVHIWLKCRHHQKKKNWASWKNKNIKIRLKKMEKSC